MLSTLRTRSPRTRRLWLSVAGLSLTLITTKASAQVCVLFPAGTGPERACASGTFPAEPVNLGPGDRVVLPLVEYINETDREMTFTLESAGGSIIPGFHTATLAPRTRASFSNVLLLQAESSLPIGTGEAISVGWSAVGELDGADDYLATVERQVQLLVGPDADGDALVDSWETNGYDPGDDGTVDSDLPSLGASVERKDLFVEIDCLVSDGNGDGDLADTVDHSHCPPKAAVESVVQAFANAPVANPDGTMGIQLHVDTGPLYGANVVISLPGNGGVTGTYGDLGAGGTQIAETGNQIVDWDGAAGNPGTSFYALKILGAGREFIFRYGLLGHQTNYRRATNDCTSGWAEDIQCNDFLVTLGGTKAAGGSCWTPDANGFSIGSQDEQAGTLMHELGHCLGLQHGGSDSVNDKPNYLSVMNYAFQKCSVPASPAGNPPLPGGCDYSPLALPAPAGSLDESSLDECVGIDAGAFGFGSFDWDDDSSIEGISNCQPPNNQNLLADINGDGICVAAGPNGILDTTPSGDDVMINNSIRDGTDGGANNLTCDSTAQGDDIQRRTPGRTQPAPLSGFDDWNGLFYGFQSLENSQNGVADPVENEPDPETIETAQQEMSEMVAPAVVVELEGPATAVPAQTIELDLVVRNKGRGPALQAVSTHIDPEGVEKLLDLNAIRVGQEVKESLEYAVAADACPAVLTNRVRVSFEDFVGNPLSATRSASVTVVDVTPPVIEEVVPVPSRPWPPDHQMIAVTVEVSVEDECDPDVFCRITTVTSDEAGRVQPAWEITGELSFDARVEREGTGSGHTYTVEVACTDDSGNTSAATADVVVPHDRRGEASRGPGKSAAAF